MRLRGAMVIGVLPPEVFESPRTALGHLRRRQKLQLAPRAGREDWRLFAVSENRESDFIRHNRASLPCS